MQSSRTKVTSSASADRTSSLCRSLSRVTSAARALAGIRASQASQRARVSTATGSMLRSRNCQTVSSRLRPPGAGLAGAAKAEPLAALFIVSPFSLGMAAADRLSVADLGGVDDVLISVKEPVAAFEPAAVTCMHAVEAVVGGRGGVGDDPGDGGELL